MVRRKGVVFVTALFVAAVLICCAAPVHAQWTLISPPTSENFGLLGIHFTSPDEGWAVGNAYINNRGTLLHYQNGTWTPVTSPNVSAEWYLTSVHFTSLNEGWAVGNDIEHGMGIILHYQDGIWTLDNPPYVAGNWTLSGVQFTSPNEGWAVGYTEETCENCNGYTGVLLHYQSGIWAVDTSPTVSPYWCLRGIHFTSSDEGWAVGMDGYLGAKGALLHYQNGTWTSVTPLNVSGEWKLTSVHFTSADEGWAVGEDNQNFSGVLLHYRNGTWAPVASPTMAGHWMLHGVHFTSATEGWAVGFDYKNIRGALLHYQNGTWTTVASPTLSGVLYAVHFTSATEGWAVGVEAALYPVGVLLQYAVDLTSNEGTIGNHLTISGSGFGTERGKVLIGGVSTMLAKDGWKPDSITCIISKAAPAGTHDVLIKPYKTADIILSKAFTVKLPEIDSLNIYHGVAGTPITITGNFFSTKKGKVYMEYLGKNKNCKVTSWGMDRITFLVPKTSKSLPPGTYPLKVTNKVGIAGAPSEFTID